MSTIIFIFLICIILYFVIFLYNNLKYPDNKFTIKPEYDKKNIYWKNMIHEHLFPI